MWRNTIGKIMHWYEGVLGCFIINKFLKLRNYLTNVLNLLNIKKSEM